MEITVNCKLIQKLEVKAKIVEEKQDGDVIDTYPVTTVRFEVRGTPGQFDEMLSAMAAGHAVNAGFNSPQLGFEAVLKDATK